MTKTIATVEDFEKLKNELGLVPMKFLLSTITEKVGDIRGAEPYTAMRWYNEGLAEPVKALKTKPAEKGGPQPDNEDVRRSAIAIPEGWAGEHHLNRVKLAKEITGKKEGLTAEEADAAIQAELDRRAAAVAEQ